MSGAFSIAADLLVAVLLTASITTSMRLSGRMARLRADEVAMRSTVTELRIATDSAERAIAGLRMTVEDCDRTLADRLQSADRHSSQLAEHVAAGEAIMDRVAQIADMSRRLREGSAGGGASAPARPVTSAAPAEPDGLRAAVAAAREVAARAARRVGERAA